MTVANEAGKIALDIMTLYSMIKSELQRFNANDPLAKNVNEQLDLLIYTGFIRHIPYTQLKKPHNTVWTNMTITHKKFKR